MPGLVGGGGEIQYYQLVGLGAYKHRVGPHSHHAQGSALVGDYHALEKKVSAQKMKSL